LQSNAATAGGVEFQAHGLLVQNVDGTRVERVGAVHGGDADAVKGAR
jgi:hypothetical protein